MRDFSGQPYAIRTDTGPHPRGWGISAFGCFWLLLLGCLGYGCEEPVELHLDLPQPKLVISSNFYPDERVTLRVSATRPAIGEVGEFRSDIVDAQVSLFEGANLAERLLYIPGTGGERGAYRTTEFRPVVGKRYTIHVAAQGFAPVTAVSSIPDPVGITSLRVTDVTATDRGGQRIYDYELAIDYDDPPGSVNYYDLRVYQLVAPFVVTPSGDTIKMADRRKSVVSPITPGAEGTSVGVLIQDRPNFQPVRLRLRSVVDPTQELLGDLVAELRTVSPEYYFFQRGLSREAEVPDGGLNQPVVIYNNVISGLGVFAGYNSVTSNLSLTH